MVAIVGKDDPYAQVKRRIKELFPETYDVLASRREPCDDKETRLDQLVRLAVQQQEDTGDELTKQELENAIKGLMAASSVSAGGDVAGQRASIYSELSQEPLLEQGVVSQPDKGGSRSR